MPRLADLEKSVPTIAATFPTNPKEDVVERDLWIDSSKSGRTRPISTRKIPPVAKAIADVKGTIKDVGQPEGRFDADQGKVHRLPRDLTGSS